MPGAGMSVADLMSWAIAKTMSTDRSSFGKGDPNEVIVSADIAFRDGIETGAMDDAITAIEEELKAANGDIRKVYIEPETAADSS